MSIDKIGTTVKPQIAEKPQTTVTPQTAEKPQTAVTPQTAEKTQTIEKPDLTGNSTAATFGLEEPHAIRAMSIFDEAGRAGQNTQPKAVSIFNVEKLD